VIRYVLLLLIIVVFAFCFLVFLMNVDECELKMMNISKVEDDEERRKKKNSRFSAILVNMI